MLLSCIEQGFTFYLATQQWQIIDLYTDMSVILSVFMVLVAPEYATLMTVVHMVIVQKTICIMPCVGEM